MDLLALADRSWPVLNRVFALHTRLYRLTGGRIGHALPGVPQMLLLDHVGGRSGQRRTTPLVYAEDGADLVLVASKGGYPRHPAWFHNLRANPDTTVQVRSERRSVHARLATPAQRPRLWGLAVAVYPGFAGYQRRTDREIPVVVLEPHAR